jgi:hypothetical protein
VIADALGLLGANACFLAAGVGTVCLLGLRRPASLAEIALAYMAGVGALGLTGQLLLVAGLALTTWQVVAVATALLAAGLAAARARATGAPPPRRVRGALVAVVALLAAFLVLLAVDFWFQPLWKWDSWAMWAAKARSIVLLDGLDPAYFRTAALVPEHPLLLPVIEAIDFRFMGLNEQVLHLQFWLLVAGFLGALVALLRDVVPPLVLWPALAAILFAPAFAYQAATAYADVPLAIFFALAGVCAWRWLALSDRWALRLLALFAAATSATKFEGLVFVGALLLVLVLLIASSSRRRAALTAAVGLVALVGVVPWRLWMAAHDVEQYHSIAKGLDAETLWSRLDRVPTAAWALVREMLDPSSWLLLVPLALAAAVLAIAARERHARGLALGTGFVIICALTAIYWLTALPFEFHVESASRVVVAPVLLLAALTPVLLGAAIDRRGARGSAK